MALWISVVDEVASSCIPLVSFLERAHRSVSLPLACVPILRWKPFIVSSVMLCLISCVASTQQAYL